jgi:hypothetical protein
MACRCRSPAAVRQRQAEKRQRTDQSAQPEGYNSGNDGGSFHRVTARGRLNLLS